MAIKHNNQIQKNHFRKDWQRRVRTHFDQPSKKLRRRAARSAKAAAVAPRPVDKLRPVVRCPTIKYNRRLRAGRGFTLAELKEAGIPRLVAPTIGIAVDHRRQNPSEESLAANVARLKAYKARLIVFPRKGAKHPKAGDTKDIDLANTKTVSSLGSGLPIVPRVQAITEISKSDLPKPIEGGAYTRLRKARSDARLLGVREKRAKEKAEAEANKK
ncbi:putative 60S ribosomal protein L13 [Durotheca rogersii]|uniref:putative 60S ribosomal protein L13 n=1 Tax=Durotheca rogersii TaxID=419775 RepID=UPI00221EF5A1|nr:putative 60S ribosomal protein L13 [Durotheca rogersii]KAI5856678.1 putative 60S ribosomal protein L13 [Durotheca rogersii]